VSLFVFFDLHFVKTALCSRLHFCVPPGVQIQLLLLKENFREQILLEIRMKLLNSICSSYQYERRIIKRKYYNLKRRPNRKK